MKDCVIVRPQIEEGISFSREYLALRGTLETHTVNSVEKAEGQRSRAASLQNQHSTQLTLTICLNRPELWALHLPSGIIMLSLDFLMELGEIINAEALRKQGG